jgi:hypothetical protein
MTRLHNSSKLLVILVCVAGIIAFTAIAHILWSQHRFDKEVSPYASYTRLVNLARGMDYYKQHNGQWPTNLTQLVIARPDLESQMTDAYGRIVILVSYNQENRYGELISYGKDGKPGGDNKYDRDIEIRFPMDTETNAEWNNQINERFKNRSDRGFPN